MKKSAVHREEGWRGGGGGRERDEKNAGEHGHCLAKLRGIKFAFYCARDS